MNKALPSSGIVASDNNTVIQKLAHDFFFFFSLRKLIKQENFERFICYQNFFETLQQTTYKCCNEHTPSAEDNAKKTVL
jgi:hypothetical protein